METPSSTLPARRSERRNASRALAPTPAGLATVGHGSGHDEAPQHKSGNRAGVQFGIEQHGTEQLEMELFNRVEPHAPAAIQQLDSQTPFSQPTLRRTPLRQTTLKRTPLMRSEGGMATAEYAIATLAAVGLAGLLVVILRSEEVRGFLLNLVRTALSLP